MRFYIAPFIVSLELTPEDTYAWAHRDGHAWPASELSGKRLYVSFDANGLCQIQIDDKDGDCSVNELNAITSDYLKSRLPKDHPAYFVTVGQFDDGRITPM